MHQKPFERVLQSLINGVFGRNFYNGPQQKVIIVGIAVIALFYPSPSFLQHLYVHDYYFQIEQCCLIPCDGSEIFFDFGIVGFIIRVVPADDLVVPIP